MQQGQPLNATDPNTAFQQFGGIGGPPSLQSLRALGPSGYQFLMGLINTFLGIPEEDVLWGAQQPTRNLNQGQSARQVQGYSR